MITTTASTTVETSHERHVRPTAAVQNMFDAASLHAPRKLVTLDALSFGVHTKQTLQSLQRDQLE